MKINERVVSNSGDRIIEVTRNNEGHYVLNEFARKYDPEEEVNYEIKVISNLSGRYDSLESAVNEAKRVLNK